jgi:hypothetical protein
LTLKSPGVMRFLLQVLVGLLFDRDDELAGES